MKYSVMTYFGHKNTRKVWPNKIIPVHDSEISSWKEYDSMEEAIEAYEKNVQEFINKFTLDESYRVAVSIFAGDSENPINAFKHVGELWK